MTDSAKLVEKVDEFAICREAHVPRAAARHRHCNAHPPEAGRRPRASTLDLIEHDPIKAKSGTKAKRPSAEYPHQCGWGESWRP